MKTRYFNLNGVEVIVEDRERVIENLVAGNSLLYLTFVKGTISISIKADRKTLIDFFTNRVVGKAIAVEEGYLAWNWSRHDRDEITRKTKVKWGLLVVSGSDVIRGCVEERKLEDFLHFLNDGGGRGEEKN